MPRYPARQFDYNFALYAATAPIEIPKVGNAALFLGRH